MGFGLPGLHHIGQESLAAGAKFCELLVTPITVEPDRAALNEQRGGAFSLRDCRGEGASGVHSGAHDEVLVSLGPGDFSNRCAREINHHIDVVDDS